MKSILRKIYIEKRMQLSEEFIQIAGEGLLSSFLNSKLYDYKNFMVYFPIKNEAPVNFITEKLLDSGKIVALPSMLPDYDLIPVCFNGSNTIPTGKYKIPEPSDSPILKSEEIEVVLVPGVLFDKSGGRIGYGKGCYDRFLSGSDFIKVGVCYEFQIWDKIIKAELHDIKMNFILTEKNIYEVKL